MAENKSSLKGEDRLIQARMKLQKEKPFFSYLAMKLNLIEVKDMAKHAPGGIGIDIFGNLYFDPVYINSLSEEKIKGVLCHEVMHCALEHLERLNGREPGIFNTANDIITNNILVNNGFSLPEGGFIPSNNSIKVFDHTFKDLNDKTSEEVYEVLWKILSKKFNRMKKEIEKYLKEHQKGFDEHKYGNANGNGDQDGKDGNGSGNGKCPKCKGEGCEICNGTGRQDKISIKKVDWKKAMVDAVAHARERGDVPAGMDRLIEKLYDTYIDWRGLLYRYITSQIPVDYNWGRPSKKSHSLGIYLPAVERETIDVMVAVDTSGSISQDELGEFLSEISSITNTFRNVDLTVIDCDAAVNGVHELKNATQEQVISQIGRKLKGGGGTSHVPVFNWINKNKPMAKFVICFTDGYTEFPNKSMVKQPVLWVVAGDYRAEKKAFPFGNVIELPPKR